MSDSELFYSLAYGKKVQLIYTGGVIPELEPLIGEEVVVRGKLVGTRDYTPIAAGSKLWPAIVFHPLEATESDVDLGVEVAVGGVVMANK